MSQMTATARPLRTPRRAPAAAPLRLMPARIASTNNTGFALLCIVLMSAGLVGLLLFNTSLAQGSLQMSQLQRESTVLGHTAADLREQIAVTSSTGALARSATGLGMVRSNQRAYLDLTSGKVSGEALPATSALAMPIVSSATPVGTRRIGSALTSAVKAAEVAADKAAAAKKAAATKAAAAKAAAAKAAATKAAATKAAATKAAAAKAATPTKPAATGRAPGAATLGSTSSPTR